MRYHFIDTIPCNTKKNILYQYGGNIKNGYQKTRWRTNTELHYNCIEFIPPVALYAIIEDCLTLKGIFVLFFH